MILVDGHADLAYNMLTFGRDYTLSAAETRRRERGSETPSRNGQTLLGWPDWVRGRVGLVFATLFAAPERRRKGPWDTQCYADGDQAHERYWHQLDLYHTLAEDRPERFRLVGDRPMLRAHLDEWEAPQSEPPVGLVILMEGADGVRGPLELEDWHRRGVRIVGPAWVGTRYAGGTGEPGPLTAAGRGLLDAMADLGMVLDVSHMAEESARQALERYTGPVASSHSNPRTLMEGSPSPDRHLSDDVLRLLIEHAGVVGIVLYNRFLAPGWTPRHGRDAIPLGRVVEHIDYVCQSAGSTENVGLGSDFDGGFGLDETPQSLDTVADLRLIGEALDARGYRPAEIEAVLGGNWVNLMDRALPERDIV